MFEHSEDQKCFNSILSTIGGTNNNGHLFDFRPPETKRAEFNKIRNVIFEELIEKYGSTCQLQCHADCESKATVVDHMIPLSSNVLNKKLREMKPENGKKAPTQSFGSNNFDNFVLACRRCNAFKMNKIPTEEEVNKIRSFRVEKA